MNGTTRVILNLNVSDSNGYSNTNIALQPRLVRTNDGITNVNYEGEPFDATSPVEVRILPKAAPLDCTDVATISSTEHTWNCETDIYYFSDPTEPGSSVTASYDQSGENWRMVFQATDDSNSTDDFDSVHFEWPQLLGIAFSGGPIIELGTVATDGVPTGNKLKSIQNKGNQTIDLTSQSNKDSDSAAWSCTNGGFPLIADLHMTNVAGTNYENMNALNTNSGGATTFSTFDLTRNNNLAGTSLKNMHFKFATTQEIAPGLCTLSTIVMTAVKGY